MCNIIGMQSATYYLLGYKDTLLVSCVSLVAEEVPDMIDLEWLGMGVVDEFFSH